MSSKPKAVQVALRIRPLIPSELAKGCRQILDTFPDRPQVRISNTDKAFTYNYVFGPDSTQSAVYTTAVQPLLKHIFEGYNLTILAYGQTGSGKTHSMGTAYNAAENTQGIIPLSVAEIFQYVKEHFSLDFVITVSFIELYQEVLYDLLAGGSTKKVLEIRENLSGIFIPGLTEVPVRDSNELFELLEKGSNGRVTGSTCMNSQSSRSHAIFTINLSITDKNNPADNKTSKFHFVDLAGSERSKKTGATGLTFREGININKGLLVLGNVISALGDDKPNKDFAPYRDSNLTRLLKDSLGGNSVTMMVACVSPADYNMDETISTMRYADRARKIQNKPIINTDPKDAEITRLNKLVQELRLKLLENQTGDDRLPEQDLTQTAELKQKLHEMTAQLQSSVHGHSRILERIEILESADDASKAQLAELEALLRAASDEAAKLGDSPLGALLAQCRAKLDAIEAHQKHTQRQMSVREPRSTSADGSINEEAHTLKQMQINKEIEKITDHLSMKQHLARQIAINNALITTNEQAIITENEAKIEGLETEKRQLLHSLSSKGASEKRTRRMHELEGKISSLKQKIKELANSLKVKEQNEQKIKKLNGEMLEMKRLRVQLIKQMKESNEQFRAKSLVKEREFAKLKQEDRKKQGQLVKMEARHKLQQQVMRRKVDSANALAKRLKDALALRKNNQTARLAGKSERLESWIRQDLDLYLDLIQAESTLKILLEDRGLLQEQLERLKTSGAGDVAQVQALEEDVEVRSAQILDLQQKLFDSDDKVSCFEHLQTMGDAKFALNLFRNAIADVKRKESELALRVVEEQENASDLKARLERVEEKLRRMDEEHGEELGRIQEENESQFSVVLQQICATELSGNDQHEFVRYVKKLQEKNDKLGEELKQAMMKLGVIHEQIEKDANYTRRQFNETVIVTPKASTNGENYSPNSDDVNFATPRPTGAKKAKLDLEDSLVEVDDVKNDPDWRGTPIGKWLIDEKNKIHEDGQGVRKRTSDGGCACLKSGCSIRCGCKRLKKNCGDDCRCDKAQCRNLLGTEY